MSMTLSDGVLHLNEICTVEDAEALVSALTGAAYPRVSLARCRQLHGAVVQALLAFRPEIEGAPLDPFLKDFVLPALTGPEDKH